MTHKRKLMTKFLLIYIGVTSGINAFCGQKINFADFSISKAVPVVHKNIKLGISIKNNYGKTLKDLKVNFNIISAQNKKVILSKKIKKLESNGCKYLEVTWIPENNGIFRLVINVENDNDKACYKRNIYVVERELYFSWWCGISNAQKHDLKYISMGFANSAKISRQWKKRGVCPLRWRPANTKNRSPEEYSTSLYMNLSAIEAEGFMLDEIGWYEKKQKHQRALEGLKIFSKKYPEKFSAVYICGSLKPEQCNIVKKNSRQPGVDILMLESYFNYQIPAFNTYDRFAYFDQRINMARDYDVLNRCIMILGITPRPKVYEITKEDLESQFIYLRTKAPEMPGILNSRKIVTMLVV